MGVTLDASLAEFLQTVASESATPGGGSIAALAGAEAAALVAMVCRLTQGKKGFEAHEAAVGRALTQAESLLERLQVLIVEDADAYDAVVAAYKMERGSDEAQAARREAIQTALTGAARVPLETAEQSLAVLEILRGVAQVANPRALSDAGVAAHLAWAGVQGARLNVEVNLPSLQDEAFVATMKREVEQLESQAKQTHVLVLQILERRR